MNILLATDGSEYSETAAGYLKRLSLPPETGIVVLYVLKDYLLPDDMDAARDFKKAGKKGAEAIVGHFVSLLEPTGCRVTGAVREGEPWREIIEGAHDAGPDLIVLGHRGVKGINRFLMGSVAQKVVRDCQASALVVRELPSLDRPMRVLYCTDGSESARYALELMARIPFRKDAEVHVLAVADVEISSLPEKYYPEDDFSVMMETLRGHYRQAAEKVVSEDSARLGGYFKDVRGRVVFGVPEQEILKAAEDLQADLIVMGSKGLKGLKGAILGSSSLRVMRHAECGILIAKAPEKKGPQL